MQLELRHADPTWRSPDVIATIAIASLYLAGAISWRWLNWTWFAGFVVAIAAASALLVRGNDQLHRLALAVLAGELLVLVAQSTAKTTLRVTTVFVIAGAIGGMAAVGEDALNAGIGTATTQLRGAATDARDLVAPDLAKLGAEPGEDGPAVASAQNAFDDATATLPAPGADTTKRQVAFDTGRAYTAYAQLGVDVATIFERRAAAIARDATQAREAASRRLDRAVDAKAAQARIDRLDTALERATDDEQQAAAALEDAHAAVAAREASRAAAKTAAAGVPEPPESVEVRTLVTRGANAVVTDAFEPIVGEDVAVKLGNMGWIVLGAFAFIGYRMLEVLNNQRYGAPIVVEGFADNPKDEQERAALTAALRERIASMKIVEPSQVPGGTATDDVVAALKDTDVVPGGKVIGAFVRLTRVIAFPPAGITVTPSYTEVDGKPCVTVLLKTTLAGRFLRSHSSGGATPRDAVLDAADFVAVDALTYTRLAPSWSRWRGRSAFAVGKYRRVMDPAPRSWRTTTRSRAWKPPTTTARSPACCGSRSRTATTSPAASSTRCGST